MEANIDETHCRIANALAANEANNVAGWASRFHGILKGFHFLPGGRIQAGAGSSHNVTLFNCFVMGTIDDSIPGIFKALEEGALTMQQGGGVGYDFSTIRPRGTRATASNTIASGPVSFMRIWDVMCATMLSTGARRGAMMATLRCDHPDILDFLAAKKEAGQLQRFNLSVQITDDFIDAVHNDLEWSLVFPAAHLAGTGEVVVRNWPGRDGGVACRVIRRMQARALWQAILRAAYDSGDPGVLFIDRINRLNNLYYCEHVTATNPCGEIPLPPYGACDLGSVNLTRIVLDPFTAQARLDWDRLTEITSLGVRLLDNVIDTSRFPLPRQQEMVHKSRRIGLGITGLADAMLMLGMRYDGTASVDFATEVMRAICHTAYRVSTRLSAEKGAFPAFEKDAYLAAPFVASLPNDIRDAIARHGIRNSHLTAIAPAGTISLLAGNVSSGIEPIFAAHQRRAVLDVTGQPRMFDLEDFAVRLWRQSGHPADSLPPGFIAAGEIPIEAHLAVPAALQPYVDNAISKTINLPESCSFEDFVRVFDRANALGLKGCTVFRANPARASVMQAAP